MKVTRMTMMATRINIIINKIMTKRMRTMKWMKREIIINPMRRRNKQSKLYNLQQIQHQLSHIPFETLLKLRASEQPEQSKQIKENKKREKSFLAKEKRTDKSAPLFRDARKPISSQQIVQEKKTETRDPRFENLSGKLALDRFNNNYKFIEQMRTNEKKVLEKQIRSKRIGKEKKSKLKVWLGKIKSEQKQKESLDQKLRIKKQLTSNQTFHAKKSEYKEQILMEKYQKLKQEGKLNSFMVTKKIRQQEKLDIAYKKINRG